MRGFLIIIAVLIIGLFAIVGWYFFDGSRNRGFEFGYYGEFNRLSNRLASIPGVVVTNDWHHNDLTLEEISFDLTFKGQPLQLRFGQDNAIRRTNRDAAIAELQAMIALVLSQTNR